MTSCANRYQNGGLLGVTGMMPINEIEQTYYLGVFDPKEQIPPQIYRIRVHGQSSLGGGQFASGWVPADVIDTLNLSDTPTTDNSRMLGNAGNADNGSFLRGRKLVAFGPEGFREVPKDHRLVMVMGNNANEFFNAVSAALGQVTNVKIKAKAITLNNEVFLALTGLLNEKQRLADFKDDQTGDAQ
jgi:hypothetical protein